MSLSKIFQSINCLNWKHIIVMKSDNLIVLLSLIGFFIGFTIVVSVIIIYYLCNNKKSKRKILNQSEKTKDDQSIPSKNKEGDQQSDKICDIDAKINKEKSINIQVQASIDNAYKNTTTIFELDCGSVKLDLKIEDDEKNDIFAELMPREDKLEVNQILDLVSCTSSSSNDLESTFVEASSNEVGLKVNSEQIKIDETQNQLSKNLLANTDFISLNATENVPKNNTLENLNILKVERIENSKIETPSNIIFRHTLPTDPSKAIDSSSALELSQNRNWGTFGGPLKRNTVFENPKHFWKCRLSSLNALDLEVEEG